MELTMIQEQEAGNRMHGGSEVVASPSKSSYTNYFPLASLAKGKFSKVYKCLKKGKGSPNEKYVVIKVVSKNEGKTCETERMALEKLKEKNFFPQMIDFFESTVTSFIVTDYVSGVSLRDLVHLTGLLSEEALMFYMAEMFVAICRLQKVVVHRDLNPNNVLLGQDGHIVLIGFGAAVPRLQPGGLYDWRSNRISGPQDYRARELIMRDPYSNVVDWWSFALTSYYLASGGMHAFLPVLPRNDCNLLAAAMVMGEPRLKLSLSKPLNALLEGLLRRYPEDRIGYGGEHEIARHPYFRGVNWLRVDNKGLDPPFYPKDLKILPAEEPVSAWPAEADSDQCTELPAFSN